MKEKLQDLVRHINPKKRTSKLVKYPLCALLGLTGVGGLYLMSKSVLIPDGFVGFADNNGTPEVLTNGWHLLASPLNRLQAVVSLKDALIDLKGPITIVRVSEGANTFCPLNTTFALAARRRAWVRLRGRPP